ncbi:MAG: PH domain-containing protein [Bryobacteraceae bacterium]|nr:PH domain-containing protein [Bryobacteraceae bacterium]
MEPFTITPTKKLVLVGAVIEALLMAVWIGVYLLVLPQDVRSLWMVIVPFMLTGLAQAMVILKSQSRKLTVSAEQLTLEQGIAQKSRQMINLEKIQDVSVAQGFFERMLNIGSITIQSASTVGALRLDSIDAPTEIANKLLAYARQANRK